MQIVPRATLRPLAAMALASLVVVAACAQATHEAAWPDLVTARQQDAIERGWVPEFLPEDARDIHQRNEPSTGAGIVVARMDARVAIEECDGPASGSVPLAADWFPDLDAQPVACPDGWILARDGDTLTLWRLGDLEELPTTPTPTPTTPVPTTPASTTPGPATSDPGTPATPTATPAPTSS